MKRLFAAILCALAVVVAVIRLGCSGGSAVNERDTSRLFGCVLCGALTPLNPDAIREQYEAGTVRPGPLFTCPSCGKPAAQPLVLNFDSDAVRCQQCGETLMGDSGHLREGLRQEEVKLDANGQLTFRCAKCEAFSGRMVMRDAEATD